MKSKIKVMITDPSTDNISGRIRNHRSGALLINCGGASRIYFIVPRIMRQMIHSHYAGHEILIIGDADRISPERLAQKLEEYIRTPSKTHTLDFGVSLSDGIIKLAENIKENAVRARVHLVPTNLETQIINEARSRYSIKLPDSVTEDEKLLAAAKQLNYNSIEGLIKESVNWFMNTPWLASIGEKLS